MTDEKPIGPNPCPHCGEGYGGHTETCPWLAENTKRRKAHPVVVRVRLCPECADKDAIIRRQEAEIANLKTTISGKTFYCEECAGEVEKLKAGITGLKEDIEKWRAAYREECKNRRDRDVCIPELRRLEKEQGGKMTDEENKLIERLLSESRRDDEELEAAENRGAFKALDEALKRMRPKSDYNAISKIITLQHEYKVPSCKS